MVSVVILNYNGRRNLGGILEKCLDSVFETDYPNLEVLFVDNASTDGSIEFVIRKYSVEKNLRIIRNAKNVGFAEGNNVGIKKAKGEYIALLNNDTIVTSGWLKELIKVIQHPQAGAVQSKLLLMDSPDLLDCAGGLLDYYCYHFERGRGEKSAKYTKVDEIFYAKGAAVLFKVEVLEKTYLFDRDVFMYFDETDLCWRIRLNGYKVFFAPESIIYHASGLTASKMPTKTKMYFHTRNHLLVLLKNFGLGNAVRAAAVSLFFEMRNFVLFLARRNPQISMAIVQALFWNLCNLGSTWKKRRFVQECVRVVSDERIKEAMLTPYPPFPLYILFSRFRYLKRKQNINTLTRTSRM
jgi:GT2 family glycosyltransferase